MFERIKLALGRKTPSVPASLLPASIFVEALRVAFARILSPIGFEQITDRKWVRSARMPIREIVELYSLKSASAAPRWGVSLDFVPHVAGGSVRWHRTPKSSMLDLVWDPLDFDGIDGWTLSRFTPPADLPLAATAFAEKVTAVALADLTRAASVADLPTLYREWSTRPSVRFSSLNYHQAALGEAFVLARLGLPGAIEILCDGAARFGFDEAVRQELLKRLDADVPTS